jgi:hypothetical protein
MEGIELPLQSFREPAIVVAKFDLTTHFLTLEHWKDSRLEQQLERQVLS